MPKIFWLLPVGIVAFYAIVIGLTIHEGREAEKRHQKGMEALVEMYLNAD